MSPLPQRKKSAEELNQLRGGLGIPNLPATPVPPPAPEVARTPMPAAPEPPPRPPKPVRSLRKSEREPAPQHRSRQSTSSFSKIPARRHNSDEIQQLRRRDAIARFSAEDHPLPFPLPAPRWITIPGYLLAFFGFSCHYWTNIPLSATAGAAGLALIVSLYILLRRPLSRHHAGFIACTTLFVLVFAALHYFPHLRHAS
jgi:hypothetical protein